MCIQIEWKASILREIYCIGIREKASRNGKNVKSGKTRLLERTWGTRVDTSPERENVRPGVGGEDGGSAQDTPEAWETSFQAGLSPWLPLIVMRDLDLPWWHYKAERHCKWWHQQPGPWGQVTGTWEKFWGEVGEGFLQEGETTKKKKNEMKGWKTNKYKKSNLCLLVPGQDSLLLPRALVKSEFQNQARAGSSCPKPAHAAHVPKLRTGDPFSWGLGKGPEDQSFAPCSPAFLAQTGGVEQWISRSFPCSSLHLIIAMHTCHHILPPWHRCQQRAWCFVWSRHRLVLRPLTHALFIHWLVCF